MITKIVDVLKGKHPIDSSRSHHWPTTRKHHLQAHSTCAACGDTSKLEVHHIQPFHLHPELELEPSNLITLCESKSYGIVCHLLIGHNGNYKDINPNVVQDSAVWLEKLTNSKK